MALEGGEKSGISLAQMGSFEIVEATDGEVRIVREGEKFELLCPAIQVPYCEDAEQLFVRQDPDAFVRLEKVAVRAYLRNKQTLKAEYTTFCATVLQKQMGIQSGIVVAPPELRGLVCGPAFQYPKSPYWIVARPFNREHVNARRALACQAFCEGHVVAPIENIPKVTPNFHNIPPRSSSLPSGPYEHGAVIAENEINHLFRNTRSLIFSIPSEGIQACHKLLTRPPLFSMDYIPNERMPNFFTWYGELPLSGYRELRRYNPEERGSKMDITPQDERHELRDILELFMSTQDFEAVKAEVLAAIEKSTGGGE